jgi:hypothetical protein
MRIGYGRTVVIKVRMDYCTKDLTQSWAVEYRCTQRWTIAWVLRAKGSRRLAAIPINHIDPSGFQKEEEPECRYV